MFWIVPSTCVISCCYLKQSQITKCYWNVIYCPHAVDSHHCPHSQLLTYRILCYEPAEDPTRIFSHCAVSNIFKEQRHMNKIYLDWPALSQGNTTDYVSNTWKWIRCAQKCLERKMLMIDSFSVWNLAAWALHPQQSQTAHPSHIQPGSEFFQPFWKPGISVEWPWAWLHIWLCPNMLKQKAWND